MKYPNLVYVLILLVGIMLGSLILAFAEYIADNVQIAQQECQASYSIARQNDYYAKAIVLLNDNTNSKLQGFKWHF